MADMDRTSPEHDALVTLAEQYRRLGNLAGLAAMLDALRETDGERFTVEPADTDQTWIVDRWNDGWIVETWPAGRGAETRANVMNTRNIRDGQHALRARLAAVAAAGDVA